MKCIKKCIFWKSGCKAFIIDLQGYAKGFQYIINITTNGENLQGILILFHSFKYNEISTHMYIPFCIGVLKNGSLKKNIELLSFKTNVLF